MSKKVFLIINHTTKMVMACHGTHKSAEEDLAVRNKARRDYFIETWAVQK